MKKKQISQAMARTLRRLSTSDLQRVGGGDTIRVHYDTGWGNRIAISSPSAG